MSDSRIFKPEKYKPAKVDAKEYKKIVKKHGPEFANGYFLGLTQMYNVTERIAYVVNEDRKFCSSLGPTRLQAAYLRFRQQYDSIMKEIEKEVPEMSQSKPNQDNDAKLTL